MKSSRVHTIRENHRWIEVERRGGFDGVFIGYQNVTEVTFEVTPPIAEILSVKNGRVIVVCGFLMK